MSSFVRLNSLRHLKCVNATNASVSPLCKYSDNFMGSLSPMRPRSTSSAPAPRKKRVQGLRHTSFPHFTRTQLASLNLRAGSILFTEKIDALAGDALTDQLDNSILAQLQTDLNDWNRYLVFKNERAVTAATGLFKIALCRFVKGRGAKPFILEEVDPIGVGGVAVRGANNDVVYNVRVSLDSIQGKTSEDLPGSQRLSGIHLNDIKKVIIVDDGTGYWEEKAVMHEDGSLLDLDGAPMVEAVIQGIALQIS